VRRSNRLIQQPRVRECKRGAERDESHTDVPGEAATGRGVGDVGGEIENEHIGGVPDGAEVKVKVW
jgi:hypothetical protein